MSHTCKLWTRDAAFRNPACHRCGVVSILRPYQSPRGSAKLKDEMFALEVAVQTHPCNTFIDCDATYPSSPSYLTL